MTWFHLTKVVFSMEYGDPSLPKLADLVSDAPDPCKDLILDYLGMNCIAACPGMLDDVITPDEIIGCGHLYADDKYYWTDCFANYVRKYNIPVPSEFRAHILKNYKVRKSKHVKHRLLRSIQITNRPRPDCFYTIHIHQDGSVQYATTSAFIEESHFTINPEDADYIVHPITETFFCYDEGTAGEAVQNGYWWKMSFFNGKGLVHTIEGFPGEADWRYTNFRELLEFVEWQTGKDLGSKFMDK